MLIMIFILLLLFSEPCNSLSTYPVQIKAVISKLTQSTQKALQRQESRINVELPVADFGVEKGSSKGLSSNENIQKSQFELHHISNMSNYITYNIILHHI